MARIRRLALRRGRDADDGVVDVVGSRRVGVPGEGRRGRFADCQTAVRFGADLGPLGRRQPVADPLPVFAEHSVNGSVQNSDDQYRPFAGFRISLIVATALRICGGDPGCSTAEHEAEDERAGTRREAQSRHLHVTLIPGGRVAD